jgi:flagellar protein FlgJ
VKIQGQFPLQNKVPRDERLQKQDEQLKQAAKMYEQHFMREMVKAMRNSVPEGGLIEKSMGEKIFSEQLDNEYVQNWSNRGGIGLADMIYSNIKERYFPKDPGQMQRPQGPLPLDKKNEIQWKAEPVNKGIQFKSDSASAPQTITAPWSGTVGQVFTTPEGVSSVELKHDQGLVSRFVFAGDVNGLVEGAEVQSGSRIGAVSAGPAPWLQWHLERT